MKITEAFWFVQMGAMRTIGIVIGADETTGESKAYLGVAPGYNEAEDAIHILRTGAKLHQSTLNSILTRLGKATNGQG